MTVFNARIGSVEMGMFTKLSNSVTMARMETILTNALTPAKSQLAGMDINGRGMKIVMMETMITMITASLTVNGRVVGTSSSTGWEARNVTMVMRLTLIVAQINAN